MKLKEDIKPISYIKTNAADILKKVNHTHRPVIITQNGEAKGIILDTGTYEEMRNAVGLLKIVTQSEREVQTGQIVKHQLVMKKISDKLKYARKTK